MSKSLTGVQAMDLLERTLDTYGSDPARWPQDTRTALLPFIAVDRLAQRKLAEAEAFDRLLDAAPQLSADRHASLADAIVARAARQPRVVTQGAAAPASKARTEAFSRRNAWAGAALAASLILGVMSGQNATVGSIASQILNGDSQAASGQQYALGDDADALLEEDLL